MRPARRRRANPGSRTRIPSPRLNSSNLASVRRIQTWPLFIGTLQVHHFRSPSVGEPISHGSRCVSNLSLQDIGLEFF